MRTYHRKTNSYEFPKFVFYDTFQDFCQKYSRIFCMKGVENQIFNANSLMKIVKAIFITKVASEVQSPFKLAKGSEPRPLQYIL